MAVQSAATPITRVRFTVEQYHRMAEAGILTKDDRVELIEGEIVEMSPIGARHQHCIDVLTRRLISAAGEHAWVRVQGPVRLGEATELQPDLALLRDRNYAQAHPTPDDVLLLIEVSDTTLVYDRDVKVPLYARHGIPEIWLIDLTAGSLFRYTQPATDAYRVTERFRRGDRIVTSPLPPLTIAIEVGDVLG